MIGYPSIDGFSYKLLMSPISIQACDEFGVPLGAPYLFGLLPALGSFLFWAPCHKNPATLGLCCSVWLSLLESSLCH